MTIFLESKIRGYYCINNTYINYFVKDEVEVLKTRSRPKDFKAAVHQSVLPIQIGIERCVLSGCRAQAAQLLSANVASSSLLSLVALHICSMRVLG